MDNLQLRHSTPPPSSASPCLEAALGYIRRGWAVIPLGHDKRPVEVAPGRRFAWEVYQKRPPTEVEVKSWFAQWPAAGVGIVCGKVSGGLVVLDCDPRHGGDDSLDSLVAQGHRLPDTPLAWTGGGGSHHYFAAGGGVPTIPALAAGIDLKGEGSYIVAPPSLHPSGRCYEWAVSPHMAEVAPVPDWLLRLVAQRKVAPQTATAAADNGAAWRLLLGAIPAGQRNADLTRIAGWLRLYHPLPVVRALLLAVNDARCCPPLEVGEVERIAVSVCRYPQPGVNGHPLAVVPGFQRETSK